VNLTINKTTYVIILNWNGWKDTIECLESLFCSEGADFVAIVCDNASADSSLSELEQWAVSRFSHNRYKKLTRSQVESGVALESDCQLVLVDNASNLGFAGGNNVGVHLAMHQTNCEYIWLLNNDTTIEPNALVCAVKRMQEDANIGLCGSSLIYYHDRNKVQAMGGAIYSKFTGRARHIGAFSLPNDLPIQPDLVESQMSYVIGAAMLVRRQFIETVGYMQDDYFLYFEEIDWATRGKLRFKLGYAPDSVVYHKEGASIGTSASGGSVLSVYYLFRNRVLLTSRHFPFFLPTVVLFCLWDILKMVLKGRSKQAVAAINGVLFRPINKPKSDMQ